MPNSVVTTTPFGYPAGQEFGQKTEIIRGNFVLGAGSYQHGGLPVSWNVEPVKTTTAPFEVIVWSASGSGYVYVLNQKVPTAQTLQIFESGASGTPLGELLEGALPAAVLSDVIQFTATFNKFGF